MKKKTITTKPLTVKNSKGTLSYKVVSGNEKSRKALKLNKKNGKIKVTVKAAGTVKYKAASKSVWVKIRVK